MLWISCAVCRAHAILLGPGFEGKPCLQPQRLRVQQQHATFFAIIFCLSEDFVFLITTG
jgi:hypothetical protein